MTFYFDVWLKSTFKSIAILRQFIKKCKKLSIKNIYFFSKKLNHGSEKCFKLQL